MKKSTSDNDLQTNKIFDVIAKTRATYDRVNKEIESAQEKRIDARGKIKKTFEEGIANSNASKQTLQADKRISELYKQLPTWTSVKELLGWQGRDDDLFNEIKKVRLRAFVAQTKIEIKGDLEYIEQIFNEHALKVKDKYQLGKFFLVSKCNIDEIKAMYEGRDIGRGQPLSATGIWSGLSGKSKPCYFYSTMASEKVQLGVTYHLDKVGLKGGELTKYMDSCVNQEAFSTKNVMKNSEAEAAKRYGGRSADGFNEALPGPKKDETTKSIIRSIVINISKNKSQITWEEIGALARLFRENPSLKLTIYDTGKIGGNIIEEYDSQAVLDSFKIDPGFSNYNLRNVLLQSLREKSDQVSLQLTSKLQKVSGKSNLKIDQNTLLSVTSTEEIDEQNVKSNRYKIILNKSG